MTDPVVSQGETIACKGCSEALPAAQFYVRDGKPRQPCKDCVRTQRNAWRAANPERVRATREAYLDNNRERVMELRRANKAKHRAAKRERDRAADIAHPEKRRAACLVQKAVRRGDLIRPDSCERCGKVAFIEGSHNDYAKPLEVEWLCRPCHRAKDAQMRADVARAVEQHQCDVAAMREICMSPSQREACERIIAKAEKAAPVAEVKNEAPQMDGLLPMPEWARDGSHRKFRAPGLQARMRVYALANVEHALAGLKEATNGQE